MSEFKEIYVPLSICEDRYLISNFGNCISKYQSISIRDKKNKLLSRIPHSVGYDRYVITIHGTKKEYYIHRLVYESFHGKLKNGYEINHIDGNKKNNNLNNLEAVTRKQNLYHAKKLLGNWRKGNPASLREYHKLNRTLNNDEVIFIRENKGRFTLRELSNRFHVSTSTIWFVQNYKSYKDVK